MSTKTGELHPDTLSTETGALTVPPANQTTVGVEGVPNRSPDALARRLNALAERACMQLAWITPSGRCHAFREELTAGERLIARGEFTAARQLLQGFLHQLEAQRGRDVHENAFWLLHSNAMYLDELLSR